MDRSYKRTQAPIRILLIALLVCLMPAGAATEIPAAVRVGVFELNGFFEKNSKGLPEGYGVDYLNKVAEKTGWTYEYVWSENWNDCIELLRQGAVDVVAPAQITEERMQEFAFSAYSIGEECGALLTRKDNDSLVYEDFEAFDQIAVGCVDTLVFKKDFLQYSAEQGFTPIFVSYRDTKAMMEGLLAGEVDAALANLFVKTDNTKVLAKFGVAPFYFMVREDAGTMLSALNTALQEIRIETVGYDIDLMEEYYPCFNAAPFTKAEIDYIQSAPTLRIACRSDIRPVSFVDEDTGEIMGITREVLEEISSLSGLAFSYVPLPKGEITYDYFRDNDISLISSVEYNRENVEAAGIKLTAPYLDSKKVFVSKKSAYFDPNADMVLAISTGSQTMASAVQDKYPNVTVVNYRTLDECFEAVRQNKADALLQNQYVVTSYLAKPLYADMAIIPVEGLQDQLCLSPVLNQDDDENERLLTDERLISILNKSIRQISDREMTRIIIQQTTENQYHYTYQDVLYQYRYPIVMLLVVLTALLLIWFYLLYVKRKSLQLITENEAKLRNITNNINGGVVVLTAEDRLRIAYANDGFLNLLQCHRSEYEQIHNQTYMTYIHPDDVNAVKELITMDIKTKNQVSMKLRIMRRDGQYVSTLFNGTLTENSKGEREIYCVIMDISEQERLIEKISMEQRKYALLLENAGDIIFEVDCQKQELMVSPIFEEKFGRPVQHVSFTDLIPDVLRILSVYEEDQAELADAMAKALTLKQKTEGLARIQKTDGTDVWCRIAQYPMVDAQGKLAVVIGKILNVDEEVRSRAELEKKSRCDALTGLLNKEAFFTEVRQYLASAKGDNAALVFLDVDNFKEINDKLGHMTGDLAIKETAKKLQVIFANCDLLARFGGDEFCILLKEIPLETLQDKLAWTVKKLRCVYQANGEEVSSTVSVGVACTYGRDAELSELLERADQALYWAKEHGKNQFVIHAEEA